MLSGLDTLDLLDRCKRAEAELLEMADKKHVLPGEANRLLGKRQGVALVRTYIEEYLR